MLTIMLQTALECLLGAGIFVLGTLVLTLASECVKRAHRDIHR